jgi:hypothetical protein
MSALKNLALSALFLGTLGGLLSGCRGQTSKESPIVGIRNMYDQPKFDIQEEQEDKLFEDGRTMRPAVEGTVAREDETDQGVARGRLDDESGYVLRIPPAVLERHGGMEPLAQRGHQRYDIYCAPCHGLTGDGKGMIVKRGLLPPPTYHGDRLRHIPDGQLYATIENGKGNMPPYGPLVPIDDRWAIVAYVRALQISQAPLTQEPKK